MLHCTCNCGLISGGVAENIVPDKCVFTADFRFKSEKQSKIVEKIAKDVAQKSFIENTSCTLTHMYKSSLKDSAKRLASIAYLIK